MSENLDYIENDIVESDSSNEELEINDKPKKTRKVRCDKIIKEKKPYVYTEGRKGNIQKALESRQIKTEIRKKEKEEKNQEYLSEKKKLEDKKFMKLKLKQEKELLKLKQDIDDVSSEEDEIIIMKKPKKKVVYMEKAPKVEKPVIAEKPIKRIAYF